jgi:PAS domain S-box-containing protein
MKRFFRDLPIARKLTLIAMLATGAALLVTCAGFIVYDQVTLRRTLARDVGLIANMVAMNSTSALTFNDPQTAGETLAALGAQPHIEAARLYDLRGEVFATYLRPGVAPAFPPLRRDEGEEFIRDRLELFRPIVVAGERAGTIYIQADLQELRSRGQRYLAVFGGVTAAATLLAFLLATRLQRVISGPLKRLASVAESVAAERDYSLRAARESDDEIGRLIERFNEMLEQIQTQDVALRRAHDELEQRIQDRTRELVAEISERRRTEEERDGFFSLSLDLLCVAGLDGRFRRVNPASRDVLGYTPEELIGTVFANLLDPRDALPTARHLKKIAAGESVRNFVTRLRHRDGSYRWVAWCAAPMPGKDYFYAYGRDVTALKQAEQQAAREKARLQFIFESVAVGISLRIESPGQKVARMINDAHLKICGLRREQLDEPGVFQKITHPEDLARQQALWDELATRKIDRYTIEKRYVKPGDEITWVSYSIQRHDYPDGSRELLTTVVDITALKQAQEHAAREQARFKFIFESVPVGISLVTPSSERECLVNPAHERITGISAARSGEPGIFASVSNPDDYRLQRQRAEPFLRGEVDHYSVEKRYRRPDGSVVWAVLTSRMFVDPADGRNQVITTLVDVTDLKRAQEEVATERARFKFIFHAVPIGLAWMIHNAGGTRVVNPAHARITGVPAERCREVALYAQATPEDDWVRQRALNERLSNGEIDHYEIEKRYIHADGSVRWAALSVCRYSDDQNGEVQEISTLIDITDRKQAEARLAETHQQLVESSRQAGMAEVATGVLHNVGNVLNSVNVSTTLLAERVRQSKIGRIAQLSELVRENAADLPRFFCEDPRGSKVADFLETLSTHLAREQAGLLAEIESLRKNIEHIKDIVAMQQSYAKVSGVSEAVSVAELVEHAVRMNSGSLIRDDLRLVRDFQASPVIVTEKHKVLQVLVNLMRNAKHACDESGRPDKEMIVRVTADRTRVKIQVIDNGVGIPRENLTRIFAHGFTTKKSGHGFGLHSGALAARELGGSLFAQSDGPGRGAIFTLELPRNADVHAA